LYLHSTIRSGNCDIVTHTRSLAMAQVVSRRPLSALTLNYVGFVVDKVAMGQVFFQVFRFSPLIIIPPKFRTH